MVIESATFDTRPQAHEETRRDFLFIATGAVAGVGSALTLWPFIDSMNPSADALSYSTIEVDLTPIELGQRITVKWRGQPVFVVHRTPEEIQLAQADDSNPGLLDPIPDAKRAERPEWLILVGVCTHLGCVPLGQNPGDPRGRFGGWLCPCHGSLYDGSGRVRRGPAPNNLVVPSYAFVNATRIRIG